MTIGEKALICKDFSDGENRKAAAQDLRDGLF